MSRPIGRGLGLPWARFCHCECRIEAGVAKVSSTLSCTSTGPDFGSCISHEKGHFVYFYLPRFLSPIELAEQKREGRKLEKEKLLSQDCLLYTSPSPRD